jgi:hypothetical protein
MSKYYLANFQAFPTLVALETSPNARVRQLASRSRAWLSSRYEDGVESAYRSSMEKLFEFRKTVVKSSKGILA